MSSKVVFSAFLIVRYILNLLHFLNIFHRWQDSGRPLFFANQSNMSSCLINDRISLKHQLLISYSIITLLSAGITLGICYGLLYSLKNSASSDASDNLIKQTNSNAQALATEIANTINQEIAVVGESVCMVSALYASLLMPYAHNSSTGSTLLKEVCSPQKLILIIFFSVI